MNFHVGHQIMNEHPFCSSQGDLYGQDLWTACDQKGKSVTFSFHHSGAGSKFINTDITNYTQKCLLNCFMVYLLCFSAKILLTKPSFCSSFSVTYNRDFILNRYTFSGSLQSSIKANNLKLIKLLWLAYYSELFTVYTCNS